MVCKNGGVYGVLCPSLILITYNTCPPCNGSLARKLAMSLSSTDDGGQYDAKY